MTQTFRLLRLWKGLLHGHHCYEHQGVWEWYLDTLATCLSCATGRFRPQTWHKDVIWKPRLLEGTLRLFVPSEPLVNGFALQPDGRWNTWDGVTSAAAFSGKHPDGWPLAVYLQQRSYRWDDSTERAAERAAMDLTFALHGCANGRTEQWPGDPSSSTSSTERPANP